MEIDVPKLRELVGQLDRLLPKEGARLRIPGDAGGNATVGTQRGYLRLGVELLRAGLEPRDRDERHAVPHIPLDIDYLLTPDSAGPFDLCEVVDVERLPARAPKLGPAGQLMGAFVAVIVAALVLLAAVAVLSRLLH